MLFGKRKKEISEPEAPQVAGPGDVLLVERNGKTVLIDENAGIEINISGVKKEKPQVEQKAEETPEKPMLIIDSVVKETNGYIEIIQTCENSFVEERQTLIKKSDITCIDRFYNNISDYHYVVLIQSDTITKRYDFERKEEVEQLYNALSKLLKKKDIKSVASKKTV